VSGEGDRSQKQQEMSKYQALSRVSRAQVAKHATNGSNHAVDKGAQLKAWNQPIHRVRGRIEKIFGTWKRSYGLRRMRWRGIAKAAVQIHLTAIAYNLKRTLNIIQQPG
jgi:IS5 family transposase